MQLLDARADGVFASAMLQGMSPVRNIFAPCFVRHAGGLILKVSHP